MNENARVRDILQNMQWEDIPDHLESRRQEIHESLQKMMPDKDRNDMNTLYFQCLAKASELMGYHRQPHHFIVRVSPPSSDPCKKITPAIIDSSSRILSECNKEFEMSPVRPPTYTPVIIQVLYTRATGSRIYYLYRAREPWSDL